jgi:hypothetical protein
VAGDPALRRLMLQSFEGLSEAERMELQRLLQPVKRARR